MELKYILRQQEEEEEWRGGRHAVGSSWHSVNRGQEKVQLLNVYFAPILPIKRERSSNYEANIIKRELMSSIREKKLKE